MPPSLEVVIQDICAGCARNGMIVNEVLAAFIARTIIEANPDKYNPNVELMDEHINSLVSDSIKKLNETNNPSLETVKMQVAFDCCYVELEEDLHKRIKTRQDQARDMQKAIVGVLPKSGSDFDALTGLYRMIFAYVMAHFDGDRDLVAKNKGNTSPGIEKPNTPGANDREVEREVAAGLESVFPRIGLKAFVMLSSEQKKAQICEMANIVLGIRLFNREVGKGGAGLSHVEEEAYTTAQDLNEQLEHEIADVEDLCLQYQETIVYVHITNPSRISQEEIKRWNDELANRRQYLSFLSALRDDVVTSLSKVNTLRNTFKSIVSDLQSLVGSRSSVPKEHVYPRFEQLAIEWLALVAESRILRARQESLDVLHNTSTSYHGTLAGDTSLTNAAKEASREGYGYGFDNEGADDKRGGGGDGSLGSTVGYDPLMNTAAVTHGAGSGHGDGLVKGGVDRGGGGVDRGGMSTLSNRGHHDSKGMGEAVLLTMASTPDFMHLPLEFQGFCPWTIVQRNGLLLPGKPNAGVVRFDSRFYVFAHNSALEAFMANPVAYVDGVLSAAKDAPELIHLLRLTDDFPQQSIKSIIQKGKSNMHQNRVGGPSSKNIQNNMSPPSNNKTRVDSYDNFGASSSSMKSQRRERSNEASSTSSGMVGGGNNQTTSEGGGQGEPSGRSDDMRRDSNNYGRDRRSDGMESPDTGNSTFAEQPWEQEFSETDNKGNIVMKRDAGTETPTHFVERCIDPSYEWNEWALRRRALQMTNIRKCTTTGAQTDLSHYRRENDSQVYLPKTKVTQTRRDGSTQPPIITQYAAGLRGTPGKQPLPSAYSVKKTDQPGILNLVLEPGSKKGHDVVGGRSHAY
mmetsp:Transcript_16187/g.19158  ORF Transcript_16187/g.19158 Transcript_16187/m.19158 type:complete len:854 (+) Transcript_16187:26-2587(+)